MRAGVVGAVWDPVKRLFGSGAPRDGGRVTPFRSLRSLDPSSASAASALAVPPGVGSLHADLPNSFDEKEVRCPEMAGGQQLERSVLEAKEREGLQAIADALSVKAGSGAKKADLIDQILRATGVEPEPASAAEEKPKRTRARKATAAPAAPAAPAAE